MIIIWFDKKYVHFVIVPLKRLNQTQSIAKSAMVMELKAKQPLNVGDGKLRILA
jgi:hypothetical protein